MPTSIVKPLSHSPTNSIITSSDLTTTLHILSLHYLDLAYSTSSTSSSSSTLPTPSQTDTQNLSKPALISLAIQCLNAAFQSTHLSITLAIQNRLQVCKIYLNLESHPQHYILLQENLSKALLLSKKLPVGHDLYFQLRLLQLRVLLNYSKKKQAQVVLLQTFKEAKTLGLFSWCYTLFTLVDQWEQPNVLQFCQTYLSQDDPTPIFILTLFQLRRCCLQKDPILYSDFRTYLTKLLSLPTTCSLLPSWIHSHIQFWDLVFQFQTSVDFSSSCLIQENVVSKSEKKFSDDSMEIENEIKENEDKVTKETSKLYLIIPNRSSSSLYPSTTSSSESRVEIDFQCSSQAISFLCQFMKAVSFKRKSEWKEAEKLLKSCYKSLHDSDLYLHFSNFKPLILHQLFECAISRSQYTHAEQLLELFLLSSTPSFTILPSELLFSSFGTFFQAVGLKTWASALYQEIRKVNTLASVSFQQWSLGDLPFSTTTTTTASSSFHSLSNTDASPIVKLVEEVMKVPLETEVHARRKLLLEAIRSTSSVPQLQCIAFALGGCLTMVSDLEKAKSFFELGAKLAKKCQFQILYEACSIAFDYLHCLLSGTPFASQTLSFSQQLQEESKHAFHQLIAFLQNEKNGLGNEDHP